MQKKAERCLEINRYEVSHSPADGLLIGISITGFQIWVSCLSAQSSNDRRISICPWATHWTLNCSQWALLYLAWLESPNSVRAGVEE